MPAKARLHCFNITVRGRSSCRHRVPSTSLPIGRTRCVLRLDVGLRFANYATFAALFVTGVIWLAADQLKTSAHGEMWQTVAANTLMVHGMIGMIALLLLGAMIPVHIWRSWRAGKNLISGSIMVAVNAVLIVTA